MKILTGHMLTRVAGRLALTAVVSGATLMGAAPAASAATAIHIPNPFSGLFGSCKHPPAPELPNSGAPADIAGFPAAPPPAGNPFAHGSHTSEWDQYGFAGLSWSTYDLGCLDVFGTAQLSTWIGNGLLWAAKVDIATDIAVHDWASTTGWINFLAPMVTGATREIHHALFTPWAGLSLLLLALTLLIRAHRADFAGAVTTATWALLVLALVAGVTAYPNLAARQISSLMGSTINSMDAGFVSQRGEAAAANQHASLLISSVLYPQWLSGELGSSTSPASRHFGPLLLENQAMTWRQADASQNQIQATETSEQNRWTATASQVQSSDPALYPLLQGTQGSRIGVGAITVIDALIISTFDIFASSVIVVALLAVLIATILLPALAVVGLHHSMRQVITSVLSRVAGLLCSAVLYSIAAGIDIRASRFLLTSQDLLFTTHSPLNTTPGAMFTTMFTMLALTIALFLGVRYARSGRLVPRAAVYAGLVAADLAMRRRGSTPAPAPAPEAGQTTVINVFGTGGGWQDGGTWSASAEPVAPHPAELPPSGPPADGSEPQEPPGGAGPDGPDDNGTGPDGGGWTGDGWRPPEPDPPAAGPGGGPPPPRPDGGQGYYLGSPSLGDHPTTALTATKAADGTWQVYRGSADLGDDNHGGYLDGQDRGDW